MLNWPPDESSTLWFKHLYGADTGSWGVIGFPGNQNVTNLLRVYQRGDPVILAIPQQIEENIRLAPDHLLGTVFGVCSLLRWSTATRRIANPEMIRLYPNVVERWAEATPLDTYFEFENPFPYAEVANGAVLRLAGSARGRMVPINGDTRISLLKALAGLRGTTKDAYISPEIPPNIPR